MWPYFVYIHRRADDGRPFYVGKGTMKRGRCERAHERFGRSKWWQRVVVKHGLVIEVVAHFRNEADAHDHERALIAEIGRERLVNLTLGGEGSVGLIVGPEARAKLSLLASRPRSSAWVASIRAARKNGGNGGVVKKGDRLPEEWRAAIATGQRGPKNYMRGRTGSAHPNSRRVIGPEVEYPSIQAAADAIGMKMKTLYNMLSGHRHNSTPLRFA